MNQSRSSYPLRMPADLRAWLEAKADNNERSLNSEIVHRLKESRTKEGKKEASKP